jgi:hypothetical protein
VNTDILGPAAHTDSVSRIASWTRGDDEWPDLVVHDVVGDLPAAPRQITAVYIGATVGGRIDYRVSVHVETQVRGASGRLIDKYRSVFFTSEMGADQWCPWVRLAVDLEHPARGGRDRDPEGSYL